MNHTITIPSQYAHAQTVKWVGAKYMPHILPENASKWLRREIARNPELTEELTQLGWNTSLRFFRPRQLFAVVQHFGPFW